MADDLRRFLSKETRKKLKLAKRAAKCVRKLKAGGTYQQKQSWKYHIAKGMAANPTRAEEKLKEQIDLVKDQYRWQVKYQCVVGPYIADCCIVNHKCVIEADGSVHETTKEYDLSRDAYLGRMGYKILHFSNEEILLRWAKVLAAIMEVVDEQ